MNFTRIFVLFVSLFGAVLSGCAVESWLPKELRKFNIPDTLYCKYFEKEFFNPKPRKVLENGVKILIDVDPIDYTAMGGQVDESERPHYVVMESPDGRRYIGTADVWPDDIYYPAYGFLDGEFGMYRWNRALKEYAPPVSVDSRWLIDSEFFTGLGYAVWNMFNKPELYTYVTLKPGEAKNELHAYSIDNLPQLPVTPQFMKKRNGRYRALRQTTGGYTAVTHGHYYGPLTYKYDRSTGLLSMSAPRKISNMTTDIFWWDPGRREERENPDWAAYCKNDLEVNPTLVEMREKLKLLNQDDRMIFFGDHTVEVVSQGQQNEWMVVRRHLPPGQKHRVADYSMWLKNINSFYVDYAMMNAIQEGINKWVRGYFVHYDKKRLEEKRRLETLSEREKEIRDYWYMAVGAAVGARKAPGQKLGSWALDNAMGLEALRLGVEEPVGVMYVFTELDDDLLQQLAAGPLVDAEIYSMDVENYLIDVNLVLSHGGKTWVEPRRFRLVDPADNKTKYVRIPTKALLDLPTAPGENSVSVSAVTDGLKAAVKQFQQSLKTVKPALTLAPEMKKYIKEVSGLKFSGRNLTEIQTHADVFASLNEDLSKLAALYSELDAGNKRISELCRKLAPVNKTWTAYYKANLKPLGIENVSSITAENERLAALRNEQQMLINYLAADETAPGQELAKNFNEEQMFGVIKPKKINRDLIPDSETNNKTTEE